MPNKPGFKVSARKNFVHLEVWGPLEARTLDAPANAAIALAEQEGLDKLLDDIRNIDPGAVPVRIQAKGMSILWSLRKFRKVAIVFQGEEIGWLFLSSLQAIHLNLSSKFRGFDDIDKATAWLEQK